jgi:flagellar biosynthesis component FlhA
MEILNMISDNKILFACLIGILIINFGCILYLVLKEKKEDKEEIEELMNDLSKPKKEEKEEKINIEEIKQDEKIEKNKSEVEEMLLKMKKDLDATPKDVVETFENEQEENSIISYQELLNSVNEKNNVEVNVKPVKIEKVSFDNDDTLEIEPIKDKKFKTTDFISPIYGKQNSKIEYPTVRKREDKTDELLDEIDFGYKKEEDNMIKLKPITNEMKKNDAFLKALKEFRKNLD